MQKCTHWPEAGTGARPYCFLLCQSSSLYWSRSRAVWKSLYPLSILEPICKFIKLKIQNRTSVSIWTTTEQCTYTQAFCVFINSRFFPFSLPPKRRQIHNFSVLFELLANILSNDVSNEFSKSVFSLLFWGLLCRVCSQYLVVECFKFCRGAVGALQHHWRHLWVNGTQQLIGVRC